MPIRSPARPLKSRGFKRGSHHRRVFKCACACLNRLNDDNEVPATDILRELRRTRDHCDYLINEILVEAITGIPYEPRKTKNDCKCGVNRSYSPKVGAVVRIPRPKKQS